MRSFVCVVVLLLSGDAATAQEFRATLGGRVRDTAGLALAGATVVVRSVSSNETVAVESSADGLYVVPFLRPGAYVLSVDAAGFRPASSDVQLALGQVATVDIELAPADVSFLVQVPRQSSATDLRRLDRGFVLDNRLVSQVPLIGSNPFMVAALVPGVAFTGASAFQRPFDNGAIADWSISGGLNRNNEFVLDGVPNNAIQNGNNIAYVPPVAAVHEVRVMTTPFDAQYGRTGGGVLNVELKSGGNVLRGGAYELMRRRAFDATDYFTRITGGAKPDHRLDHYGGHVDGPIRLPFFDGRNRAFFMFAFDDYSELTPNPQTLTVPDEAQLQGDFSQLRDEQGLLIPIYDPETGREENGQWVRDPFPGNRIPPDRINPVARALTPFFLRPNVTVTSGVPGKSNYVDSPNHARDDFYNVVGKVDVNLGAQTRMFVRYGHNRREEHRVTNGIGSGPALDGQAPLSRVNHSAAADLVRTWNAAAFNVRGGLTHYLEFARSDPGLRFDPAALGFSPELVSQLPTKSFPRINLLDGTAVEYTGIGRASRNSELTRVVTLHPNGGLLFGDRYLRLGVDMRWTRYTREITGNLFVLTFDHQFTRRTLDPADRSGNALASFLLGAPSAGAIENQFYPVLQWHYYAPWVQHDWRPTDRLTVNLGVRWDLNTPVLEREDRLNAGFDTATTNPVTGRLTADAPPQGVRGGLLFVRERSSRYPYRFDWNNVQPRLSAAYVVGPRTVLRGGYGLYYLNVVGVSAAHGYSVQTPAITTHDGGRMPLGNLTNPFPDGLRAAPAHTRGLETLLGGDISFSNPDFVNPYVHQFSASVHHALPWNMTVDLAYVGSRTRQAQNRWGGFNSPPAELRDRCDETVHGEGAADYCDERLPNPFYQVPGFEGTSRFSSPTLTRYELSRPYPQFGRITMLDRNDGRVWYDSAQLAVQKALSDGLSLSLAYTLAKSIEENGGENQIGSTAVVNPLILDADRVVQRSPPETDRRHRLAVSGVYTLPFGRDGSWLRDVPAALDALVGGWTFAGVWAFHTGRPWGLPQNVAYVRTAALPSIVTTKETVQAVRPCVALGASDDTLTQASIAAGCTEPSFVLLEHKYRRTAVPFRDDRIRRPSFDQLDLNVSKTLRVAGGVRAQVRIDIYNVLNRPLYDERQYISDPANPLFGAIDRSATRQSNPPRTGQLALRLLF